MKGLRWPGLASFSISAPRFGGSSCSSFPLRSFAGYPHGFGFVHTNARTGLRSPKSTHVIVMISSTIAGSSRPVFAPSICGCHEDDGALARMLKLVEPPDHAARVQPIDGAQILAPAIAGRFRRLLCRRK